jgi:Ca2+-binding RTX toxin-like protein
MTYRTWGSTIVVTGAPGNENPVVAGIGLDRFVYAWQDTAQDGADASGSAIRMRVFDPFGIALPPVLVAGTTTVGNQANPQVLGLANGHFVVAWEDNSGSGADTSGTAIRGQVFDANGARVGGEFIANTTTAGNQAGVALARNGSGFVVAWVDGSGADTDIRAQRFDASGNKLGGEILAGASTAGHQRTVRAADTDTGFALAWLSDDDANGTLDGVHVQSYTSTGAARGGETTTTAQVQNLQEYLDIARIDGAGDFAVEYRQPYPPETLEQEYRIQVFSPDGVVLNAFSSRVTQFRMTVGEMGRTLVPWAALVVEPGAVASGSFDGFGGRSFVFASSVDTQGLHEGSTVRRTDNAYVSGSSATVRDAAMLQDGRIVIANRENDGTLSFNIADGRGPNFGAADINRAGVVLVGADTGEDRNNVMTGTNGGDTLYGLGGNDYCYGYAGSDLLVGGNGSDVLLGESGNDTLYGEADDDYLYASAGTNVLVGGAGVDVVYSQGTNDTSYGGDGGDYLYCYGDGVTLALGEAGNDIFIAPSRATASIYDPDRQQVHAYGGEGNDYFYLGTGSDLLSGGAGVDVLQGGGGADTYDGGAGTDYLFLSPSGGYSEKIDINAQSGVDVVHHFNTLHDIVRLQGTALTSYAQLLAATTDYGSFSVITIDANTAIWLIGIAPSEFTPNNFQFS